MDAHLTRKEEDVTVIWPRRLLVHLAVVNAFEEGNGTTHDPKEEGVPVVASSVGVHGLRRDHIELTPDGWLPHGEDMLEKLHENSAALLVTREANARDTEAKFSILEHKANKRMKGETKLLSLCTELPIPLEQVMFRHRLQLFPLVKLEYFANVLAGGVYVPLKAGGLLHKHGMCHDDLVLHVEGNVEAAQCNVTEAGDALHQIATVAT